MSLLNHSTFRSGRGTKQIGFPGKSRKYRVFRAGNGSKLGRDLIDLRVPPPPRTTEEPRVRTTHKRKGDELNDDVLAALIHDTHLDIDGAESVRRYRLDADTYSELILAALIELRAHRETERGQDAEFEGAGRHHGGNHDDPALPASAGRHDREGVRRTDEAA